MHAKRLVDGVQVWVWIAVVFALLGLIVGGYQATRAQQTGADPDAKQPAGKCAKAEEFKEVPGLGPSCRKHDGTWKIKLRDGTVVESHGPDSAALAEGPSVEVAAALSSAACVTDLNADYYGLLVYVYASDQPDNSATANTTIRNYFQGAQDKLYAEFQEFGQTGSYKMACNADGSLRIAKLRLSTPLASMTFSTVQSDLRAAGYNSTRAKYWIYTDKKNASIGYCGIGGLYSDDRLILENYSNRGPSYGFNPACNAFMHENGHNMGAVQNSAPNSSGAGHCNDDRDVMCYDDDGPRSGGYSSTVCTDREHWDCNHNDYFHPNPPAGNYLATHWNIGSCLNRFILRSGCGTPPPPTATRTRTATPGGTVPTATRTRTATSTTAVNRALNKPATSDSACNTNETAPKAVNGSVSGGNSDKWCSLGATKWLRVDLGASYTLTRFVVKHAGAGGESTTYNTSSFNIQTSPDGTTWTTVVTVSGNTASTTTHTIAARSARYVRLNVTTGAQSGQTNIARIYELEVY